MKSFKEHSLSAAPLTLVCAMSLGLLSGCEDNTATTPSTSTTADLTTGTATGAVTDVATRTLTVSGRVLNVGYLANTQVCADVDDNGLCGTNEPSTTTNAQGSYSLTVPTGQRGMSLLAVVRPTSIDSASTTTNPIAIKQGWTLPTLLEYDDNVTHVTANITPITATYYARIRQNGRNRLNNQIAMFTRIIYTTNIDPVTGLMKLPVDVDYVTNPQNTLADRLKSLNDVLSTRAETANSPLSMLTTYAVLLSWYNTYTAPTAKSPALPVDATKIASFAATSTSSVEYILANDYRYFRPKSSAALGARAGFTETAGWLRKLGTGDFSSFDRRAITLASGQIYNKLESWIDNAWKAITVDEGGYYSLSATGNVVWNSGTDYLQERVISATDGNRITFKMPNSHVRWAMDVADSPATHFFIEEWVGQQKSYASFYNGVEPTIAPLSTKPACAVAYPNSPQPPSANTLNGTTASSWYSACFDYYTAEYYDKIAKDVALKGADPKIAGANFYDITFQDALAVLPQKTTCGSEAIPMAKVTVLGKEHCNWAVDAQANHTLNDLFATSGVTLNSWTQVYGEKSFTTGGVTTKRSAGTAEQIGLPQQLTLNLVRNGTETSGIGTLSSPYGAWTTTSYTPTVETITWQISPENPNMVLIAWPFRDVNDPRVLTSTASNGSAAVAAPVLPAGHFTAVFNGNTFSAAPSTHTAPNYRKLAIALQEGVFVTGQYYGKNHTFSERYFTTPALEKGMTVLGYVFNKLYNAGFKDQ
jgi:hypothetical protein